VLLTGTERVSTDRIARAWKLGHSDVGAYDPERGAAFYLTKSLQLPDATWDLSPQLNAHDAAAAQDICPLIDEHFDEFPLLRELREGTG
jgi:hypothetical protein